MTTKFYGPPGTGKTTTLVKKLQSILEDGTPLDRIGFFSFTRKAAEEVGQRARDSLSLESQNMPWFSTLHAMCFKSLGLSRSDVFAGAHLYDFARACKLSLTIQKGQEEIATSGATLHDMMLFLINLTRIRKSTLQEEHQKLMQESGYFLNYEEVVQLDKSMHQYKQNKRLLDFTDMLEEFLKLKPIPEIDVLFVDEAQDLSPLQWSVVELLEKYVQDTYIAGDDDQAIFEWAGASPDHLNRHEGGSVVLGQSYRIPRVVHSLANNIIGKVPDRQPKEYAPRQEEGVIYKGGLVSVLQKLDLTKDTMILVRNRSFIQKIGEQLARMGITYTGEGSVLNSREYEGVLTWTKLCHGLEVTVAEASRVYEMLPSREAITYGFKTKLVKLPDQSALVDWGTLVSEHGLIDSVPKRISVLQGLRQEARDFLQALSLRCKTRKQFIAELEHGTNIQITTIHGAKGGEACQVVLVPDMVQKTFNSYIRNPAAEHRVFYVAVTRAKESLSLVQPTTKMYYQFPI